MSRAPLKRWRTLPPDGRCEHAESEAEIRKLAREATKRFGRGIAYELWAEDHPQDSLNRGWACVGVVEYERPI